MLKLLHIIHPVSSSMPSQRRSDIIHFFSGYRNAYKIGKKEQPPFLPQAKMEPQQPQQPKIPQGLQCPLCKELLRDAVVTPCCGNSFCDECECHCRANQYTIFQSNAT